MNKFSGANSAALVSLSHKFVGLNITIIQVGLKNHSVEMSYIFALKPIWMLRPMNEKEIIS